MKIGAAVTLSINDFAKVELEQAKAAIDAFLGDLPKAPGKAGSEAARPRASKRASKVAA